MRKIRLVAAMVSTAVAAAGVTAFAVFMVVVAALNVWIESEIAS